MHVIDPLLNTGTYIERHEYWYSLPTYRGDAFVNAEDAHNRFLKRWVRDIRHEDAGLRRDAREQFNARMVAV